MYKQLVEGMSDLVIVVGGDFKIAYANQVARKLVGVVAGTDLRDRRESGSALSVLREIMKHHLEGHGHFAEQECEVVINDQSWVLEIKAIPLKGAGGSSRTAFHIRDITAQRKAEAAFRSSEKRFRIFNEGLSHAVHIIQEVDGVYRYVHVNPAFTRNTGYTLDDLKDKSFFDIIHPDFHAIVIERAKARLKGEQVPGQYELKIIKKDGQEMWSSFSGSIIEYNGRPAILGSAHDITEIKIAQEQLEKTLDQFSAFINSSDDFVVLKKPKGERLESIMINNAFARYLGRDRDELIGKTDFDVLPPDVAEHCYKTDLEALKQGRLVISEEKVGNAIYETRKFPVALTGGETGVACLVRDITDLKMAQEALKESQQMLFNIINSLPYATFVIDKAGVVVAWNRAIEGVTGITASDIVGKGNYEYAIPFYGCRRPILIDFALDPTKENANQYSNLKRRRDVITNSGNLTLMNGREFYFWSIATILYDLQGEIVGAVEAMVDLTELRQAEMARQQSEEKFRALTEQSPDVIMMFDRDLRHQYVNPAIQKYTKIKPETFLGKTHQELGFPPGLEQPTEKMLRNTFFSKKQGRMELDLDSGLCFDWLLAPVFSPAGDVVSVITSARDITEYKKAKESLAKAEKMEAIGTLAGGIAHDFNNLLQGIMGYASLMKMDNEKDSQNYLRAQLITEAAVSAGDLTRQLLGFARGGKYNVGALNVNEAITKSVRMFGRTKKEISIHSSLHPAVWTVEADKTQLEQVLLNLYVNAWQAMPNGGDLFLQTSNVWVDEEIARSHHVGAGRYVRISVTDTGVGMDGKTVARIFEPFFTTKEMGRGTGLGLASAYGIIKGHGGFVNVYSEKGHGSTFNIYLPASGKEIKRVEEEKIDLPRGHETILLVDDEPHVLKVAEAILKTLGYRTIRAESGQEAVEIYLKKKSEIDLVILDMIMPKMSGKEVFAALKQINPQIKAILSSGYTMNSQAKEIMEMGISTFVQKPYAVDEIAIKLREVLGGNAHEHRVQSD